MFGHHSYTNIDGHDPDIMTATPELPDFRRIKHNQRWIAYYYYQHLYCPLLYCLVSNIYMCCVKILLYSSISFILIFQCLIIICTVIFNACVCTYVCVYVCACVCDMHVSKSLIEDCMSYNFTEFLLYVPPVIDIMYIRIIYMYTVHILGLSS